MYYGDLNKALLARPKFSKWFSAPVIILFWIVFWPVGAYLTYKRAKIDKKAAITISVITIICGVFFLFTAFSFNNVDPSIDTSGAMGVGITLGLFLIFLGIYTIISAKKCLRYVELVVSQGYTSIEAIAASVSADYDKTEKNIQRLINVGYFTGAYIDEAKREIVYRGQSAYTPQNIRIHTDTVNNPSQSNEAQVITCKSCGAINKVIGAVGECEFCGSPISI